MLHKLTSSGARLWLYSIATAVLAVLVFYRILSPESVPLWLALLAAIFGMGATGTAAVKVHQQRKDGTLE